MASFTGDVYFYFPSAPTFGFVSNGTGTATDGLADTTFTVGESVTGPTGTGGFGDGEATFIGTFPAPGGATPDWAVFTENNSSTSTSEGTVYLFVPPGTPTSDLPADFNALNASFSASNLTECFLTGTRIATPDGETAVEDLKIGDEILTADGKTVPVRWVGWQKVVCAFQPPERLMPVRVEAGALGHGLPKRDLTLTADHALHIDGMLINAGTLVNDTTITRVPLSEFDGSYTVYHVETEHHDLILAEGTAAETYVDYLGRKSFHNYAEFVELYGDTRTIPEMDLPRISAPRLVPPATRARLAADKVA
ncbi:Hint domain-containing protein [Tateyamaria sp. ANG-S1]|uniref:Hint domain-containing protein n=1 Tax=Tateyamaria sp. ANG-S1 TaxID=1577905 RepID=UPI00068B0EDC|nr:Hint domain-containing protein [Tateyamaria sp. ANG-S1]